MLTLRDSHHSLQGPGGHSAHGRCAGRDDPQRTRLGFRSQVGDSVRNPHQEVLTAWCTHRSKENDQQALAALSIEGDTWLENVDVEVDRNIRAKKKARNILAAMFGQGPVSGSEELNKVGQCLDYQASEFENALGRTELVDEVDHVLLPR